MEPPSSSCSCSRRLVILLLLLLRPPTMSFGTAAAVSRTITVDQRGGGDFTTVQAAVNSVPDGNRRWVRIHVTKGSYREKVTIPREKRYILLEGDGSTSTDINYDGHAHSSDGIGDIMRSMQHGGRRNASGFLSGSATFDSATFTVLADDFVARHIAFKNMFNAFDKRRPVQAVAALVGGDRSAFYDCAFYGFQDTLCDFTGRHYFHGCFIKGAVDFIFGYGQTIYDGCFVYSDVPPEYGPQPGWITAHARQSADAPGGLVFKGGIIMGTGKQYLGRAWNKHATVVFYRVDMNVGIVPPGWDAWNAAGDPSWTTFTEVGCTGPGSNMAGRVPWEKRMSEPEVQRFVDMRFIDDGWLSKLP